MSRAWWCSALLLLAAAALPRVGCVFVFEASGGGAAAPAAPRVAIRVPRESDVVLGAKFIVSLAVGGLGHPARAVQVCLQCTTPGGSAGALLVRHCELYAHGGGRDWATAAPLELYVNDTSGWLVLTAWVKDATHAAFDAAEDSAGGMLAIVERRFAVGAGSYAAAMSAVTQRE